MKYTEEFSDPSLVFDHGVAAIDVITLKGAGQAIEPHLPSKVVALPEATNFNPGVSFEDLMQIDVNEQEPSVRAIIDTKKMTWDQTNNPQKVTLTDYTNSVRQAVSFDKVKVTTIDDNLITRLPLTLVDGRPALMWFAEFPLNSVQQLGYYELFTQAKAITSQFDESSAEVYDQVKVPAQQIDYEREMSEILQMNPELAGARQIFKIALDDTGARVYVETVMLGRMLPQPSAEPKIAIFGKKGAVIFWLTEPNSGSESTPFAVVATTSEAWLNPDQRVDFDFEPKDISNVPDPINITAGSARQKAEELLLATDPEYKGNFGNRGIEGVGYLFWQEVRGGGSIIIGLDGGVLFSNATGQVSPEDLIQAYKDGKRTNLEAFGATQSDGSPNSTISKE